MADVKGLLADPEFQALDPASQKQALGRIDKDFANLTDQQFTEFKTKLAPSAEKPGLMQRIKDSFTVPSFDTFMHGGPIRGRDGVERMPQGGFSPAEEFVLGGIMPAERVPAVAEAAATQLKSGRVGKFFRGISEKAENIATERKAASDPDFAKLQKSAEDWKPVRGTPGQKPPLHDTEYGPAPSPKKAPSKAEAVKAAPAEPTVAPKASRSPRESDEFYANQGRLDKVFRVADDMFRKKITAKALEAKGKPPDMSDPTWKHILFRLRGLETGRVKSITPE